MPNFPPLDASVQWKIRAGAIRFQEPGYRATVEDILSSGLATEVVGLLMAFRAAFEFDMMRQAWKGGAPVPTPARRVENLLAMRYLGDDASSAPRLIDVEPEDPEGFRGELSAALGRLVGTGVVHGDLSAFNVLIFEDRPFFIDFSDAIRVDRIGESPWRRIEEARVALTRDVRGLASYFRKFDIAIDVAKETERLVAGIAARAPKKRSRARDAVAPRLEADALEPESLHETD